MARNRELLEPESESELESTVVQADSKNSSSRSRSKRMAPARSGGEKREKKSKIVDEILKERPFFMEEMERPYFIEEMEWECQMLKIKIAQTQFLLDCLRKKRLSRREVVDNGGGGD